MSDTPRCDIMASGNSDPSSDEYAELLAFARQLEREIKRQHDPKMRLHTHPNMESDCKVPEGHVIIDKHVFDALFHE